MFMSLEFWKEMRVYVIGILEGDEKEDGAEKELEEVMDRNILELGKRHKHKESRSWGFPSGAVVENPPANAGDTGSSLVWEDPTCRGAAGPVSHNY